MPQRLHVKIAASICMFSYNFILYMYGHILKQLATFV